MKRFIIKKSISKKPLLMAFEKDILEIKNDKNINNMDTQEKIMLANSILNNQDNVVGKVKKINKEKGLIEKTESSKIILTEDNRELLND
jgi:hypothetical protein